MILQDVKCSARDQSATNACRLWRKVGRREGGEKRTQAGFAAMIPAGEGLQKPAFSSPFHGSVLAHWEAAAEGLGAVPQQGWCRRRGLPEMTARIRHPSLQWMRGDRRRPASGNRGNCTDA